MSEKKILTAVEMRKIVEEFKQSLKDKSIEELKTMEQDAIKAQDENDVVMAQKTIKLPTKGYDKAAAAIVHFLNKQPVNWQFAGMMLANIKFWEVKQTEIGYALLDYLLNMLGGLQYTGKADWERVIAIDEFIAPIKEEYGELRANVFILAEKHNAIMEALKIVEPFNVQNVDDEGQEEPAEV